MPEIEERGANLDQEYAQADRTVRLETYPRDPRDIQAVGGAGSQTREDDLPQIFEALIKKAPTRNQKAYWAKLKALYNIRYSFPYKKG